MTGVITTIPKFQFSDADGAPLALGTVTTYITNTTTPATTWKNKALNSANTNPIQLDANGECVIWLDPEVVYTFVLKNAAGSTIWTTDNIAGALQAGFDITLAGSSGSSLVGFLQAGADATARTAQSKMRDVVSVMDFGAVGDGTTDDHAAITAAYAALVALGGGTMLFPQPPSGYRIDSPLNFTSTFVPITLKGESNVNIPDDPGNDQRYGTKIWCNTYDAVSNPFGVAIDATGHESLSIEDLSLDALNTTICTTPSRIGVLAARTAGAPKNQNHHFTNFTAFMPTSGNAAAPSCGLYAIGTELGTYINLWLWADLPLVLAGNNVYSVTSPFLGTISTGGVSTSVNTFVNTKLLAAYGLGPGLRMNSVYATTFIDTYFYNNVVGTQTYGAIECDSSIRNVVMEGGNVENFYSVFKSTSGSVISRLEAFRIQMHNNSWNASYPIGEFSVNTWFSNEFSISTAESSTFTAYDITVGVAPTFTQTGHNKFDLGNYGDFTATFTAGTFYPAETGGSYEFLTYGGADPRITIGNVPSPKYSINGVYANSLIRNATAGSELASAGWVNNATYPYDTFTPGAGANFTRLTTNGSDYAITGSAAIPMTIGRVYEIVAYLNLFSGVAPTFRLRDNQDDTGTIRATFTLQSGAGPVENRFFYLATATQDEYMILRNETGDSADLAFTSVSVREIPISSDGSVYLAQRLYLGNLLDCADNAAALAAGLQVGVLYRNGDALQVVH